MRVVVFEQDRHVGGTAHTFRRAGYTFPAGPLSFTAPGYVACALRDLGVKQPLEFERAVFQVRRPPLDAVVSVPLAQLEARLVEQFPSERAGIAEVLGSLEELIRALHTLGPGRLIRDQAGTVAGMGRREPVGGEPGRAEPGGRRPAGGEALGVSAAGAVVRKWENVPARTVIERHLKGQALRDLLGSQGTSGTVMSMVLLAQMWDFMAVTGIWYPTGGVDLLGRLLRPRLEECGGTIVRGMRVESIGVSRGRVTGVALADGSEVRALSVVSDADYRRTILDLLPVSAVEEGRRETIGRLPLSPSAFTVFLGIDPRKTDLSAFRGHHMLTKLEEGDPVPWVAKRPRSEDFLRDELWLSWWSRHDERLAPEGREALMIKVMAPFGAFGRFGDTDRGHRPQQYQALKSESAAAVVAASERVIPGLSSSVEVQEVATPVTYRDWGHRSEGSVAGWSWNAGDLPDPWSQEMVLGPVRGLFLVGLQAYTRLFYGGTGTSVFSGLRAADLVLAQASDS